MKKILHFVVLLGVLAGGLFAIGTPAIAQVYPINNPTYTPNARMPDITVASGVAGTSRVLNSVGTVSLQLSGTCTSLVGSMEGSVNGTNWVTLNLYPYNATVAGSAVTSVTTTGVWFANTSGLNNVRMNNSAVSGVACIASMAGSSRDFVIPR